jgi:hypothetical protein
MLGDFVPAYLKRRIQRLKEAKALLREQKRQTESKNRKAANDAYRDEVVSALQNIHNDNEVASKEQKAEWERAAQRDSRRFWLDVAAIIVAAFGAFFLFKQQSIMQGQLDEMQADQRPWIRVELVPEFSLAGVTKDQKGVARYGGGVPMEIYLSNVGHSPAFNIRPTVFGYVAGEGHNDAAAEQKRRCDQFANAPLDNPARGTILFPDEKHVPWNMGGPLYVAGFNDEDVRKYGRTEKGRRVVTLYVIGCVAYGFGEPRSPHQTGFIYEIEITTQQAGKAVPVTYSIPADAFVPGANLSLIPGDSSTVTTN